MKKVLVISTSLRNNANSEILAKEFTKGAKENGNDVEFLSLKDKDIKFCKGCMACQKLGKCVINDDANAITEKIRQSQVIVWATPIYYYEMSGQMKTLIDRANSMFSTGKEFSEVYVITTSAENEKGISETVLNGVRGWIACFDNVKLCGCLEAGGLEGPNEATNRADLMNQAYNMGKNV